MYTTCPGFKKQDGIYLSHVVDAGRWTEDAGFSGLLVYTDNSLMDPWLLAQILVQHTTRIAPLVAVQPIYTHPFTAARMVAGIARLHGRQVHLNLVSGGFTGHLTALGDSVSHDERYTRLVEYGTMMRDLLTSPQPVTRQGSYFTLDRASLPCAVDSELLPPMFVSGSSPASAAAARALAATRLTYPLPPEEIDAVDGEAREPFGVRLGIIARPDSEAAWKIADARYPHDPAGRRLHGVAAKLTQSEWHLALSRWERTPQAPPTYWLHPFRTARTLCPYLVGSYADVAVQLQAYWDKGVRILILDVPWEPEDLEHVRLALDHVRYAQVDTIPWCQSPPTL